MTIKVSLNNGNIGIKKSAGVKLPGNNFPLLFELAFITCQERHLKVLEHKGLLTYTNEC